MSRLQLHPVNNRHFEHIKKTCDIQELQKSIAWNNAIIEQANNWGRKLNEACQARIAALEGSGREVEVAMVKRSEYYQRPVGTGRRTVIEVTVTETFTDIGASRVIDMTPYYSDAHSRKLARGHADRLAAKYSTKVVERWK